MKYIIIAIAFSIAASVSAQTVKEQKASIERQWSYQIEIKDSVIAGLKRDILEALSEPDKCLHREQIFSPKPILIPVKELRAELAGKYRQRDEMNKEFWAKDKALADKK